ncbi:regulatory protein RecX [candidate division KSB1 bacterium]|nr:MAG: regulatory protein RecX [candidate division KSB1 bacterium]
MKTAEGERKAAQRKPATALSTAVRLLSARPYSERKLREKLTRKFSREEIDYAIQRLKDERLLNDRKYAEDFVRARLAARPRTGVALLRDLFQRGVPRTIAQDVVKELAPKESDEKLARELVRRKATHYAGLDEQTRWRRLSSFLARRGFSFDVIQKVLRLPPEGETEE